MRYILKYLFGKEIDTTKKADTTFDDKQPGYILIPEESDSNVKYPVFYMIHGAGGCPEWRNNACICGNVNKWQKDYNFAPMIVVMPNVRFFEGGVASENYESFGRKMPTFMQSVRDSYGNIMLSGCENTAIAGYSLGGASALYASLLHNELFLHTAAFSPSSCINYIKNNVYEGWIKSPDRFVLNNGKNTLQYIGYGTNEPNFMHSAQHYVNLIDTKFIKDHGQTEDVPMNRFFRNDKGTQVKDGKHGFETFNTLMQRYFAANIFGEHSEYKGEAQK